ncbi:MAG: hypothetical protein ACXWJH_04220, partial [Hyphomicrobium sp.]
MLAPNDERMNALRARWQGVQQWLESSLRLPPQARGQWTWPRLDVPRLRGWSTAGVNWFTNTHAANMRRIQGLISSWLPKGLYARALIIIIAPIVLLESVVAFTFMERHWNQVTRRLSEGLARDMAAIVDLYEQATGKEDIAQLVEIAQNRFGFSVAVLPASNLPTPQPKPFFDLLDRALSDEIRA